MNPTVKNHRPYCLYCLDFAAGRLAAGLLTAGLLTAGLLTTGCGPPPSLVSYVEDQNPGALFSVDTRDSVVALTLDDGPHAVITPQILDTLAKYDSRATFFVMGKHVPGNEDILERIVAEGHELGNHMYGADPSALLSEEAFAFRLSYMHGQLASFDTVRWYRPASGWYTEEMLREVRRRDYRLALGSIYSNDAWNPFPGYHSWYILTYVEPGSVIVLHEGSQRRRKVLEILHTILPELTRRGYEVTTLSELVEHAE